MPPTTLTKWGLFNMTDTELRATIANMRFPITGVETDGAQKYYTFKGAELDRLLHLINSRVAAERTAIKAKLPKFECDYHGSDNEDHNCTGCVDAENSNNVIDQVTQVIDGREGV